MTEIPPTLDRYGEALNQELEQVLAQRQGLLYRMMLYQMGWMDEQGTPLPRPKSRQLRPTLCLLSCEALSGEYRQALPAAAAMELVHTFSIVHEDVQNGSLQGHERPSVWWVWGPGQAINVGDGLHSLGRMALFRLRERGLSLAKVLRAMTVLDEACLRLCEGQHMDLAFQEKLDVSLNAYLKMAEDKTGSLVSCAMELGGIVATEDERVIEAFRCCGSNLGIALHIRKDILGLWGGSQGGAFSTEVLNKKKSFPIVQLLEQGDLKTKRRLGTIYFKRVLEPSDLEEILALLEEKGARESAQAAAQSYYEKAIKALEGVELSSWGLQQITELGQYIVAQQR